MEAAKIEARMAKGTVVIYATGRTGRGQSYVKAYRALKVHRIGDKSFKEEMTRAVEEMLGSAP